MLLKSSSYAVGKQNKTKTKARLALYALFLVHSMNGSIFPLGLHLAALSLYSLSTRHCPKLEPIIKGVKFLHTVCICAFAHVYKHICYHLWTWPRDVISSKLANASPTPLVGIVFLSTEMTVTGQMRAIKVSSDAITVYVCPFWSLQNKETLWEHRNFKTN